MERLPGSVVYSPAELGLNVVAVAALATVDGAIVPWKVGHRFRVVAWRIPFDNVGGPLDLLLSGSEDGSTFFFTGRTLVSAFTTAARPNTGYISAYADSGKLVTGTILTVEVGSLFEAPFLRFSIRNNHATIATTNLSMTATLFE